MQPWELAAREAIRDLVASYTHFGDTGRLDELCALFAVDGVLELDEGRLCTGRDALRAFLGGTSADLHTHSTRPMLRHHVSSLRVTVDDAVHAHGASYFFAITERGPDHWGRYRDRYVCLDGAWRFAHRRVRVDGWAPGSWAAERRARTRDPS
jgi:hypothetical protein